MMIERVNGREGGRGVIDRGTGWHMQYHIYVVS